MLQINGLSKIYGSQRAVDNLSFDVVEGEILGFLGPNGAGKSTTMKIACTYIQPTEGNITVYGHDVVQHPLEVRRLIGYLPEHNPLYLDMYVHEYLRFCGKLQGMGRTHLRQRITEVIDRTGLGREQAKKIGALSKGYRQRVGLAQAMLHNPKVLILDEPTTGLDPVQIVEIRQLIKELGVDRTLIFSSHIMQEVQAVCDRVVIINNGKLVANDLMQNLRAQHGSQAIFMAEYQIVPPVNSLKSIPGVLNVQVQAGNTVRFTAANADVRAHIFNHAAQNQYTLLGLQQQENSLEQVFRSLTTPQANAHS